MAKPIDYRRAAVAVTLFLLYLAVVLFSANAVHKSSLADVREKGRHQLNLYVTHLRGQLEKYEFLPELLSTNKRLVELLQNPKDPARIEALNRYLETINTIADASDTYLMDIDGLTIAASNWQSERPFVGRNFSYRPYFQNAIRGHLGRYFALGTTSGKRGYYFAYPVRYQEKILGAVVMKVNLGEVEQDWRSRSEEVLVTDPDGVIFITTRPEWRFRSLYPLEASVRERIIESSRYPGAELKEVPVRETREFPQGGWQIRVADNGPSGKNHESEQFLVQEQSMPEAGWKVMLLTPMDEVREHVFLSFIISSLLYTAFLLMGLFLRQRRKRLKERARYEEQAQEALREAYDQLEIRVQERTIALSREIDERRNTEAALRRTQDELIQAAKLAVIGQMSAGISHELNQPLAAIRSYADNARLLLEKGRGDDASWNLTQIAELTERMAQISSQLKLFARKTTGERSAVSVHSAIEATRRILRPQLKKTETAIFLDLPDENDKVLANPVQFEQVLVNLVGNALNALEAQSDRHIEITAEPIGEHLRITVRDNGPGIPEDHLERIFDPFFTTREAGLGLGLSISHRLVESMGGTLEAANHPDGGAMFTLELPIATANSVS